MQFKKVSDVLSRCEDTDYIRILYTNDYLVTSGSWYMDNIQDMKNKRVVFVYREDAGSFDIWHVYLK